MQKLYSKKSVRLFRKRTFWGLILCALLKNSNANHSTFIQNIPGFSVDTTEKIFLLNFHRTPLLIKANGFNGNYGNFLNYKEELNFSLFKNGICSYYFNDIEDLFGLNSNYNKLINTKLYFTTASKTEQRILVDHYQPFLKNSVIGLKLIFSRSDGFYRNENSKLKLFNYKYYGWSRNKKYLLRLSYLSSKCEFRENGGLVSDSVFIKDEKSNSELYDFRLNNSASIQANRKWSITNTYNIIKILDSLNYELSRNIFIRSEFSYMRSSFLFESNESENNFFNNYFQDSATFDSSTQKNLSHDLIFGLENFNFIKGKTKAGLALSFKNEAIEYNQTSFDSVFDFLSYKINATLYSDSDLMKINLGYSRYFKKENAKKAGYIYYANFDLSPKGGYHFSLNAEYKRSLPSLQAGRYYSNNFRWMNNFEMIDEKKSVLKVSNEKYKTTLSLDIADIHNYIFYNSEALPEQYEKNFIIYSGSITNRIHFKKITFENFIIYEKSENEDVIRFPKFRWSSNLYLTFSLFNNKMIFCPGTSVNYFSSYYANAYMPGPSIYYIQNDTRVGNYPYLDLFMKFEIKNAEFYLKSEHINAGLTGKNYFITPHYPMPGRVLKFILNWTLFN